MARTETGTAIDRVLRNAASGSRDQLVELERAICTEIDGAVTARKGALADKWRAVSRVVYGIGGTVLAATMI